ncbi:hypothetical protein AGMMS49573_09450 [Endomicrobiia bacterium]|nr:hypothetical protein AGMMS49573_09450 [Endomicrobiia bacterium]
MAEETTETGLEAVDNTVSSYDTDWDNAVAEYNSEPTQDSGRLSTGQEQALTGTQEAPVALEKYDAFLTDAGKKTFSALAPEIRTQIAKEYGAVIEAVGRIREKALSEKEMLEEQNALYMPIAEFVDRIAPEVCGQGINAFNSPTEYLQHLVDFDREYKVDAANAIASMIAPFIPQMKVMEQKQYTDASGVKRTGWYYTEGVELAIKNIREALVNMEQRYKQVQSNPALLSGIQNQARVRELEEQNAALARTATGSAEQEYERAFELFAKERDSNGNLTHPFFDVVRAKMGELCGMSGKNDLQELYDLACLLDPKIKEQMYAANAAAPKPKANKLGVSFRGGTTGTAAPKKKNVEDVFAEPDFKRYLSEVAVERGLPADTEWTLGQ